MGKQGTSKVVRAEQTNPLSAVWDKLAGRKITGMRVSKRGYANRLEGVQFVLDEGEAVLDVELYNGGDNYDPAYELSLAVGESEDREMWSL